MKLDTRLGSLVFTTVLLGTLAQPAFAQPKPATGAAAASAPLTAKRDAMDKITGKVQSIDIAQRSLTIKGPKGRVVTLTAGPDVRNLDQFKAGDTVVVRYLAALSLTLMKDGVALPGADAAAQQANAAAKRVEITADVVKLDAKTQTVTLRGPNRDVPVKVYDAAAFKAVRIGDKVQAVYSEPMALSVEPASGKK